MKYNTQNAKIKSIAGKTLIVGIDDVKAHAKYYKVKSQNVSKGQLNLIVEVRV